MDTYLLHPATAPPSYDHALAPSSLKPTRFNIQPRPDEGHESLPPYSCSLSLQNVFLWKMELEGAIHQAADREWKRVVVSLQGTALNFYKVRGGGLFGRKRKGDDGEMEKERGGGKGGLIRSYNLQFAEVGIAADYTKYVSSISGASLVSLSLSFMGPSPQTPRLATLEVILLKLPIKPRS
jgi:hypothetical protein